MNVSLSLLLTQIHDPVDSKKGCAIDVGAHCGDFSSFLVQTGLFNSVVAFEPNYQSFEAIKSKKIATESCEFQVVNAALSSESGSFSLYSDADTATGSLLPYASDYEGRGQLKKQLVSVYTLDNYFDSNEQLGSLRLIKIDTQGNDLSVIKGAQKTLSRHRPIIQTEFIYVPLYEGQCSPAELTEAISALDYKMYSLNNLHVTNEGRLAFCDAIFIPDELAIPITQKFICIDDQLSFSKQLEQLTEVCAERLRLIEMLDAEVRCLHGSQKVVNYLNRLITKVKSWVR